MVVSEPEELPAQLESQMAVFTGKRRRKFRRQCACGCGQWFTTTFKDKLTINDAHRKRMSRHVRAQKEKESFQ